MRGSGTKETTVAQQAVVRIGGQPSVQQTTILVAMEDDLLRSLLVDRLSLEEGFAVQGGVSNPKDLIPTIAAQKPEVLLFELQWVGTAGISLLESIVEAQIRPLVVAISSEETAETQLIAARAGAHGFVGKSQGMATLCEAIRTVKAGGVHFALQVSERVFDEYHRLSKRIREQEHPAHSLSEREREVLVCVADGLTNKEIADQLYMSIHTVKLHVQRIFRKLDIPNRTEAAVFAVREGLVSARN